METNRIWIWDATFHAIPPGLLRDRGHGVSQVDRHPGQRGGDRDPGPGDVRARTEVEGLLELLTDERLDLDTDDPRRPILLAVSDNGPPMTARDTRAFMALMAIAQHHGRPHTRRTRRGSDLLRPHQGRVAASGDHHRPSLARRRISKGGLNTIRFVCTSDRLRHPDDEHEGRGQAIRQARRDGRPRPPATPGLPSQQQKPTRREDAMNWVISTPSLRLSQTRLRSGDRGGWCVRRPTISRIIYTSGTTGTRRGWRSIATSRVVGDVGCRRGLATVWTQCHSLAFDYSVWRSGVRCSWRGGDGGRFGGAFPEELHALLVGERSGCSHADPVGL